jgi:hypothetical protein
LTLQIGVPKLTFEWLFGLGDSTPSRPPAQAAPLPPPDAAPVGTGIVGLVEQGDGMHAPRTGSMPQNGNMLCQNGNVTVVFL